MKDYLLNIMQPQGGQLPAHELDAIMRELAGLNQEMKAAGVWVFAVGLSDPDSSTVVRPGSAGVIVADGPFSETKEHVGGFTMIRAQHLDEALEWAGRLTSVVGLPIEVRPVMSSDL